MKFCPGCLLLKFSFFQSCFPSEFFQLLSDLLIFGLNMMKITLSCIEIVFIFPAVEASVIFLYDFSLFIEEFALFVLLFSLLLQHKLATANISSPNSLYFLGRPSFVIKVPFDFKHSPIFLNNNGCSIFFISEFFGLIHHVIVLVYEIAMSALPFFQVCCHDLI